MSTKKKIRSGVPVKAPGFPSDPSRELQRLNEQVAEREKAMWDAKDKREEYARRLELPRQRALLTGKCFRYRNTYGIGGKGPFWSYRIVEKVVDVLAGRPRVTVVDFEIDCCGKVSFHREKYSSLIDGWMPISRKQLEEAFTKACSAAGAMYATALGIGGAATKERVRRTGAKRTAAKPGASRATPKSNRP